MRRLVYIFVFGAALLVDLAHAQSLQHRLPPAAEAPASTATAPAAADARRALPLAAEGEYRWGEAGEVIELYVEDGALRGYLTRRSERQDANSAPMTFSFAQAEASGSILAFTTRRLHGDWYSFQGRVVRGPATSLQQDGSYLLQGTLTIHLGLAQPGDGSVSDNPVTRRISLKLAASSHQEK